jgi:ubiquinone biosynthesis protein
MEVTMSPQSRIPIRGEAKRVDQILRVLARYGLGEWISKVQPELIARHLKSADGDRIAEMSREERIRSAITELGTTFIKLGQILSTRADLVGPDLADELSKLQSNTPADPPEAVRTIVENEIGKTIEEAFQNFDLEAMASASIGQVHAATLHGGQSVVVKVQHEGIEKIVSRDLEILASLAELAERHSAELRLYQPSRTVADFKKQLLFELDFDREARNLEQFNRNFADETDIRAPTPFRELSSKRVLTMERFGGTSVAHAAELRAGGVETSAIAERGADAYMDMIFRDGFYHADPHPGNIFVLPDGKSIGFLDFGMIGRVDDLTSEKFEGVLGALLSRDDREMTYYLLQMGEFPADLDRDAFQRAVSDYIAEYVPEELGDVDLTSAANAATDLVREHHIVLDPAYSMILKVLVTLEGTARILTDDFNLAAFLRKSQPKLIRSRFAPVRLARTAQRRVRNWDRLAESAPGEIADILERLRAGTFDINLEHRKLDRVTNRVVYGILAAALFLGSVVLWAAEVPPMFRGVSVLGLVGLTAAVVLGARLLRAIHRSGDL